MDHTTAFIIPDALDLLRAGKKAEAQALLLPVIRQDPDNAEAWYLLGFTFAEPQKRVDCFQQVLRIDPSNQAAQKQIAKLTNPSPAAARVGAAQARPFTPQGATPAFTEKPRLEEPNREVVEPKKPFPFGLVLAVAGVLLVFVVTAIYIWNGISHNNQVSALFAERKCAEVVQSASFTNAYPRIIFASSLSVYQQVDECRSKLAIEQAVSAQDWPAAYATIGDYLTAYPGGVFAVELREQVGDIALSWAQDLVAKNDFSAATQNLKMFTVRYPASPDAGQVSKTMLDDYLAWAKYAFDQKDYELAVQNLELVRSNAQSSPEQVQQASQGLAFVYMKWGQDEVESGALEQGLQHYAEAKNLDPGLADYDRLVNQAKLVHVDSLAAKGKFDEALEELKVIAEAAQSEDSQADVAAAQARLMDNYAHSNSLQAQAQMVAAGEKACKKEAPELPIFGLDTENVRFAFVVPFTIEPPEGWLANTPAELHYALCLEESQAKIESCAYTGGHTLRRMRFTWALTVYNVVTGERIKSTKLQGPMPPHCPARDVFTYGVPNKDVYGTRPPVQQIIDWLETLKLK